MPPAATPNSPDSMLLRNTSAIRRAQPTFVENLRTLGTDVE